VYKSHLVEGRAPSGPAVDSARQNLASTFVNAFVNAAFGQDKLMTGRVGPFDMLVGGCCGFLLFVYV
jgi:26S proteasome regulatory subunit N1